MNITNERRMRKWKWNITLKHCGTILNRQTIQTLRMQEQQKTLCHIIHGIRMGRCAEEDFRNYVDANFDNEDFAEDVKKVCFARPSLFKYQ